MFTLLQRLLADKGYYSKALVD